MQRIRRVGNSTRRENYPESRLKVSIVAKLNEESLSRVSNFI
jgi:hypothetical protein